MAFNPSAKKWRKVVEQALKDYQLATDEDNDELSLALDDYYFAFAEDGQWDDLATERRRGKPRYTLNQVAPAINECIGNYRQNRIEMKARPLTDASKNEVLTYNGLLKAIIASSDAEEAKDAAFKGITVGGYGAIKVINQYSDVDSFYQDVCIKPIHDAIERVHFDPRSRTMTASDGKFVFIEHWFSRDDFESKYPDASLQAWPDSSLSNMQSKWGLGSSHKDVLVVDYYVKEPITVERILLSDGTVMDYDGFVSVADELAAEGISPVESKKMQTYKVMCYRMNGAQILEEPVELPTSNLPIIRVLGFHEWVDGSLHFRGIVRQAKDAQRVLNYAFSADIEATALSPKGKVLATPKMIKGHENTWRKMNDVNSSVLLYTPDEQTPGMKPERFDAMIPNQSLQQQAAAAQMALQASMGRRSPAVGESATDRSGRAILALQRQDDTVTFELLDNLAKAVEQCAVVACEMIPHVYDTERQVAILGEDDETEVVTINEMVTDSQTGKKVKKFDINRKYKVKASVGPAYETKRSEMVNVLETLAQDQQLKPLIADLFAKSLDFPFADELTKRIRKVQLQQGIVDPTEEEAQELAEQMQTPEAQQQAQIQQMLQQLQMQQLQLQNQEAQARIANLVANVQNLTASANKKIQEGYKDNAQVESERADVHASLVDSIIKKAEAGLPITMEDQTVLSQSLSLLDASQREDFNQRIQANLRGLRQ